MSDTIVTRHRSLGRVWRLPKPKDGCTPWFSGRVQPVQPGVYQRAFFAMDGIVVALFARWDDRWYRPQLTPADAAMETCVSSWQHAPWRGLLHPPLGGYGPAASDSEGGEPC